MLAVESSWFYSSLSQVTAAIVGFIGGFLILRLLGFMTEWRELRAKLEATQRSWAAAKSAVSDADLAIMVQTQAEENRLWIELVSALQQQGRTVMPVEIAIGAAVLGMLIGTGIFWPLLALEGPSNVLQLGLLTLWALIMLGFTVFMYWRARAALTELKGFKLWPWVEQEYDQFMLQTEAHTHESEQEKASTSDDTP